ncbi:MAG TPA: helicase-related protein, partial [Gemmatimonadaceae bacterium]|nr:helicase-related protein [Gemmatimonadaceae bacterium]
MTIVDCGLVKTMELRVVSPVADMDEIPGTIWPKVVDVVHHFSRQVRTTLVFVNNRATAERIAARLNAQAEEELAQPYHGSLARERRQLLEERLKAGELRVLVATSSLELGIDIGSVDLVIQLQSPKRVSAALQRVGRAGHTLGAVSRGILVPTFRDDAVEIAAIVGAMRAGEVEPTRVPQNALDVLAQTLVAAASVDDWTSVALFELVRGAYPYHRLTRAAFDEVLGMLAGKYPADLAAELEPRLTWDRVTDRVSGSRRSRMLAVISGGTIPDRGLYTVNLPDRTRLGELDEEFVHESRIGDVFQLGSSTWRIAAIEHDRVIVHPAPGAPARMPFWHGEYMARSLELSRRVGALRREVAEAVDAERKEGEAGSREQESGDGAAAPRSPLPVAMDALAARYGLDAAGLSLLSTYIAEQRAATEAVPDERTLVIEQFRDELGAVRIVLHSVFGGRVNAPWGMALAQRVREALGVEVQLQTTDDGIMLRLPDMGAPPPIHALTRLSAPEALRRVTEEVGASSLFGARFRMNAARALLLPRDTARRRMPLWLQRLKALDLLETVRQWPSFPILVETYREVLQDAFDLDALGEVLGDIEAGRIAVRVVETETPSPFAASLQFGFVMDWLYADDTPRAERQAALLSIDRGLLDEVMGAEPDEETLRAMEELLAERRGTAPGRRARSADELAHLLDWAGDLSPEELRARVAPEEEWRGEDPMAALLDAGRAVGVGFPNAWRIIPTESYPRYRAAYASDPAFGARVLAGRALEERAAAEAVPEPLRAPSVEPRIARREVLARWVALAGPVTVAEARARYGWPARWIEARFTEWQRTGRLVRGRFRPGVEAPEWCSRRVAEAARRRALAALRRQIEATDFTTFAAFLHRWQHLDPRERMEGAAGLEAVLRQLEGVPRPAAGWERDYLPARLGRYDPAWLSQLGASGRLVWAGEAARDRKSGLLTLAAVRFFERGGGALWLAGGGEEPPLSDAARVVRDALARMGASFMADLEGATRLGMVALRDALRELVAAGVATNDTVEALREVIRTRPLPPRTRADDPDPTRWLPADFTPSAGRRVVQRRPSAGRLPRWRRPDAGAVVAGWVGRWSLVRTPGTMGPERSAEELAEAVAHEWLDRYGIVARDWWRRERPAVPWRAIYRELRRLEMRGEVRRGYFVRGLAGAQFALPDAVERLRAMAEEGREGAGGTPFIVLAASDPANPWSLPLEPL